MSLSPYRQHLQSSDDLVTTYEATRAGFVSLALERNRRATPLVAEARALQEAASRVAAPADLLGLQGVEAGLLCAAGLSDKALGHLQAADRQEALRGLIENFLEPAGEKFVEELVFRFLLTRGDTLGGSMRNIGGILAQRRLMRAILAALRIAGIPSGIYLALGELKGGIDPAGADEHWKTARAALDRIRSAFPQQETRPHMFFVGAAIEKKMAGEIWEQLLNGALSNAANLNNENQVASLSRWLCAL